MADLNKAKYRVNTDEINLVKSISNENSNKNQIDFEVNVRTEEAKEQNSTFFPSVEIQNSNKESKSRIIYTKEFLILLKNRDNSKKFPGECLPRLDASDENHWDPEKYSNKLKTIKSADDKHGSESYIFKRKIRSISTPVCSLFEPQDIVEVNFCSLNTINSFHVNVNAMRGAIQQLYSAINTYGKLDQVELEFFTCDEIYLGLSENFWYRVKLMKTVGSDEIEAFCIDNAKKFKPETVISCPIELCYIPPFALNVVLHGVKESDLDLDIILKFAKNNMSFFMKIVSIEQEYLSVEFYDRDGLNLNRILTQRI